MASQEKWNQWKPYELLGKKYNILSICDDPNGLTLLLENSEYLHYISKTSGGISDALMPLIHIAIFTTEELFEILTPAEPKIEVIKEDINRLSSND